MQNEAEVAWIVGTHVDPERDIQFTRGPVDDLEDASDLPAFGSKMGIDATRKWPSEGFTRAVAEAHRDDRRGGARRPTRSGQKIRKGWKRVSARCVAERARRASAERDDVARARQPRPDRRRHAGDDVGAQRTAGDDDVRPRVRGARRRRAGVAAGRRRAPARFGSSGTPASIDAAVAAVARCAALAGDVPLTGFSLADLLDAATGGALDALVVRAAARPGSTAVAEVPLDRARRRRRCDRSRAVARRRPARCCG